MADATKATHTRARRFSRRRILIVDDDPTFAVLATETLQQSGFEVQVASTAQKATSSFGGFAPDLVLLDVELPGVNGLEVCRFIRQAASNADVPVVVVTGHDDTNSIEAAYEAGATDFLHKPVLWPTLANKIDFMLRALDNGRGLLRTEKKNRALLQALPDTSFIVDANGVIAEHLAGSDTALETSFAGNKLEQVFPAAIAKAARQCLAAGYAGPRATHEYAVTQGEQRRWYEARFRPQPDGTLLIVTRETTERRRAKARIEFLAYNDALTQLPNRSRLLLEATQALKEVLRSNGNMAVLHVDLDRFKRVNDNLGHSVGNTLLKSVAGRLEQLLHPGAQESGGEKALAVTPTMVARLGADEFAVLLSRVEDEQQVVEVAEGIIRLLAEPFDCGGHHLVVTPSVGIAMCPRDSNEVEDLLVKADMAMYRAKEEGRNGYVFFGQSIALRTLGRLALETDMRRALEERAFYVCYQPKLELGDGSIVGVEALLRWRHPGRGQISPDEFIPLAEETGLIVPLGEWVLREVCEQLQRWRAIGISNLTAAVNVSVQQFMRHDFKDSVVSVLNSTGIEPARLELEITESLLMRNTRTIAANMQHFRALGVALSIDDFGTGYSSLGHLRELPVSSLKIDRSFVGDLGQRDDAAKICAAIIALARELKLKVVAEGVETPEQLAFLEGHHCDQVQGYLISRPLPAREVEELLLEQSESGSGLAQFRKRLTRRGAL